MRTSRLIWFAFLSIMACSSDREPPGGVTERDSAGIRIIESSVPAWHDGEAWTVAAEPLVQIGTAAGDETAQLFRVQDVARLGDGRIVVVNSGTHELKVYSANGQYSHAIGRGGGGPGEFDSPRMLWVLPGDSLVVLDFTRISVFDSTGAFVRAALSGSWSPQDRFADGTFLRLVIPPGKDPFQPGYLRPLYAVVRTAEDGSAADTLTYIPGDELFRQEVAGGVASHYAPVGAVRTAATHGDSIYTGDGSAYEVWDFDQRGVPVRIIRRASERTPVDATAIRSFEAFILDRAVTDAQRVSRNRLFREWTYPSFQPAYDRLLVDAEGNVWTRHFSIGDQQSEWTVFDPAGRWLGVLALPPGLNVKEIGSDYVLGVAVDDLDVEYVRLYALAKPKS